MARQRRPPNAEQLRSKIDRGETGDKVPALDPAASPLGTDDEAAGSTPDPDLDAGLSEQQKQTAARLDVDHPPIAADSGGLGDEASRKPLLVWAALGAAVCVAALMLAVVLLA